MWLGLACLLSLCGSEILFANDTLLGASGPCQSIMSDVFGSGNRREMLPAVVLDDPVSQRDLCSFKREKVAVLKGKMIVYIQYSQFEYRFPSDGRPNITACPYEQMVLNCLMYECIGLSVLSPVESSEFRTDILLRDWWSYRNGTANPVVFVAMGKNSKFFQHYLLGFQILNGTQKLGLCLCFLLSLGDLTYADAVLRFNFSYLNETSVIFVAPEKSTFAKTSESVQIWFFLFFGIWEGVLIILCCVWLFFQLKQRKKRLPEVAIAVLMCELIGKKEKFFFNFMFLMFTFFFQPY